MSRTVPVLTLAAALLLAALPAFAEPPTPPKVASKKGDHHELQVLQAPASVGQAQQAELRILPRAGYKFNKSYPTRIQLKATGAAQIPKAKLAKADALELSDKAGRFPLRFTPTAAGSLKMEALVKFSVCDKRSCLLEKETLTWTVAVQPAGAAKP